MFVRFTHNTNTHMSLENEKNFQTFDGVKRKRIDSEESTDYSLSSKQANPNYNLNQLCINKIFKNIMDITYRIFKSKSESNKKDSFENRHRSTDLISLEKGRYSCLNKQDKLIQLLLLLLLLFYF